MNRSNALPPPIPSSTRGRRFHLLYTLALILALVSPFVVVYEVIFWNGGYREQILDSFYRYPADLDTALGALLEFVMTFLVFGVAMCAAVLLWALERSGRARVLLAAVWVMGGVLATWYLTLPSVDAIIEQRFREQLLEVQGGQ